MLLMPSDLAAIEEVLAGEGVAEVLDGTEPVRMGGIVPTQGRAR